MHGSYDIGGWKRWWSVAVVAGDGDGGDVWRLWWWIEAVAWYGGAFRRWWFTVMLV